MIKLLAFEVGFKERYLAPMIQGVSLHYFASSHLHNFSETFERSWA